MALFGLFRRQTPHDAAAQQIYGTAVAAARRPALYGEMGVPDTLDGRFEMILLHLFAVLHRLRHDPSAPAGLSQALFDTLFADMDRSLREMGAGDMGVAPRVKRMTEAFNGRVRTYDRVLQEDDAALRDAIARNVYGTVRASDAQIAKMADYLRRQCEAVAGQGIDALAAGQVDFPEPADRQTTH